MNNYRPKFWFRNGHIQSILPSKLRKVKDIEFTRERIDTPDNDFLDLDWLRTDSKRLIIISHGLEGHSRRSYVMGLAKAFHAIEYDALAWNYRGCSGEMNRQFRLYHNGAIDDLDLVIEHALAQGYKEIVLAGFSMGGNMTLLYLGKKGKALHPEIKAGVTFSVPLDLADCSLTLEKKSNRIYMKYFLKTLRQKAHAKKEQFPDKISVDGIDKIKNFREFDGRYTAPIHGFKDAFDYWEKCSSLPYLPNIQVPTLIVNAKNDPFLGKSCYPKPDQLNSNITFEQPQYGGHVGFVTDKINGTYYSEERAVNFICTKQLFDTLECEPK